MVSLSFCFYSIAKSDRGITTESRLIRTALKLAPTLLSPTALRTGTETPAVMLTAADTHRDGVIRNKKDRTLSLLSTHVQLRAAKWPCTGIRMEPLGSIAERLTKRMFALSRFEPSTERNLTWGP